MIDQLATGRQPQNPEAVIEVKMLSRPQLETLLLQLDEMLDSTGVPGDIFGERGLPSRLGGYISAIDPAMRREMTKQVNRVKELRDEARGLRILCERLRSAEK